MDYLAASLLSVLATALLLVLVPFTRRTVPEPRREVLLSIVRFEDTMERHLALNSRTLLEGEYRHPWVAHTLVLCVGDGPRSLSRLGRGIVGVDIPLPAPRSAVRVAPRLVHTLRDLLALVVTLRLIRRRRIRVIEVLSPSYLMWRGTMLRWLLPLKLVTQVRGNLALIGWAGKSVHPRPLRQALEFLVSMRHKIVAQLFYRSCDLVIAYNVNNLEGAICEGAHPDKVYLTRIRVDRSALSRPPRPRDELQDFPASGRVVAFWSRLALEKRVIEATRACLPVLDGNADAHLVVIGQGECGSVLREMVEKAGLSSRVHFLGYRPREYIRQAAGHSAVVIVPYGGSSLVEAALLGRPTVAFDIEWHRELVRDGETGWLADHRSVADLTRCICEALENPAEAGRRGLALCKLAGHMFDPARLEALETRAYATVVPRGTRESQALAVPLRDRPAD
jgi:glycosyltransferase involved in cell wall biosynthesis